jgi:hypothetical protein
MTSSARNSPGQKANSKRQKEKRLSQHNPDEPKPNREKAFWYPDFTNRPDQKSNGLNPGDSANPDTTRSLCFFSAKM